MKKHDIETHEKKGPYEYSAGRVEVSDSDRKFIADLKVIYNKDPNAPTLEEVKDSEEFKRVVGSLLKTKEGSKRNEKA